jgi:threonine synthase
LIVPLDDEFIVTKPEGNTNLYVSRSISDWTGVGCLTIKHEGENPTGSFKDRGMTAGISVARALGMRAVACASTGNTSAAMASYASQAGMRGFVFIPSGKIAYGKLAQSLAYGATTIQIDGDFDDAMRLVQQVCDTRGIYLLNSANPFRIEGQKAIGFELLQDLDWHVPDWVILPGGNLGNSSALHKGLVELRALGLIDKLPRIAVIQAQGANPLARWFSHRGAFEPLVGAETLATAIRIGSPVSFKKCIAGIEETHGFVTDVTDAEILEAKAVVDASGIGAEPASCASIAGLRKLVESGIIDPNASVAAILTGHVLKDPDTVVHYHRDSNLDEAPRANRPRKAPATLDGVLEAMGI